MVARKGRSKSPGPRGKKSESPGQQVTKEETEASPKPVQKTVETKRLSRSKSPKKTKAVEKEAQASPKGQKKVEKRLSTSKSPKNIKVVVEQEAEVSPKGQKKVEKKRLSRSKSPKNTKAVVEQEAEVPPKGQKKVDKKRLSTSKSPKNSEASVEQKTVVSPKGQKKVEKKRSSTSKSPKNIKTVVEDKAARNNKKSPQKKINKGKITKKEVVVEDPPADESSDEEEASMETEEEESEDGSENGSDDDEEDDTPVKKGKFFSDDNAKWLKPKKSTLLSSDDEDDEIGDDDEMIDAEEDSDEEMEVEKQSRLLDARQLEEAEEADEELRETVSKYTAIYHLPTKEELGLDVDRVVPPSELKSHIQSILEALAEFKQRREPGRARSEYIERLGGFMAELYGYLPELIEYFLTMFSPAEALEFVEYSDKPRPMVIRTNTLKTRRKDLALALMKRGVSLDPLASWSKVGLKIIESPVPVGATPEYLSGHYMLQSAASMCPVLALSPQPRERVLDMSAAPGGKTSYLAQLMRNTGVVFANDLKPDRQKATVANMHRLGVKNVVACAHDGRKMPKLFRHYKFDRVLLDAPCSGLGVISRDPSCKVQRTLTDVQKTAHLQKELLLAAIDMLNHKSKTGGVMVYSTCSISVFENEEVVNYALQKRDIKIIDTGLDFGKPGFTRYQQKRFHPSVALTRRFYPHVHNMDGFFVCKIQKLSDKIPGETKPSETTEGDEGAAVEEESAPKMEQANGTKREEKPKRDSKKKSKKRRSVANDREVVKKPKNDEVAPKISVPPSRNTQKKKKPNAKMTKPRRMTADKLMM